MTPTLPRLSPAPPGPGPDPPQSWVATGSLEFTPGEQTQYSSTNFVLLGLLLAQLTGVPSC
jgi:CubicO group peptidase (beta-lactamase class C family)